MTQNTTKFRPPIVTVMGHIDHGKTTLLDKIRQARVAQKESGGITQHISSYQTEVDTKEGPRLITFIDTPGHAAFCAMRSRGANVTDIVVLVISATDGVMAQTKECIKEIKNNNLPVIVALTKFDLDTRNPDMVKGQLVEMDLVPEDYGGQIAVVPVSGKTGEGIDKLLELILLNADIMELKAEPDKDLEAVVIESRLDNQRGPLASVIVKQGTLRVGDQFFIDTTPVKVKALVNSEGKNITEAGPATPVEILGFTSVPMVGSVLTATPHEIEKSPSTTNNNPTVDTDSPQLHIVLKADVEGTLEALKNSLSDDVKIISSGVGPVNDNDIVAAKTGHAQLFAFNVPVNKTIRNLADNEKVTIIESKIIYEIIENIKPKFSKCLIRTSKILSWARGLSLPNLRLTRFVLPDLKSPRVKSPKVILFT